MKRKSGKHRKTTLGEKLAKLKIVGRQFNDVLE
jgi:hypothetical protein